jgi:hypothetical protein
MDADHETGDEPGESTDDFDEVDDDLRALVASAVARGSDRRDDPARCHPRTIENRISDSGQSAGQGMSMRARATETS